jgi:hypothetical protein
MLHRLRLAESGPISLDFAVPLYFFRIRNGRFSGASDHGSEHADRDAAWTELTKVCGDLVGSIARKLKQNSEWQMELLDESKNPLFRISLNAETLGNSRAQGDVMSVVGGTKRT